MNNNNGPVLTTELQALRLAVRALDEKIDHLTFNCGYSAADDNFNGQTVRNHERAFIILCDRIKEING